MFHVKQTSDINTTIHTDSLGACLENSDTSWWSLGEMLEGDGRDGALMKRLERMKQQYPLDAEWLPGPAARYLISE
jgi:hypothetical protein